MRALSVTTLLALAAVTVGATGPASTSKAEMPGARSAARESTMAVGALTGAERAAALQAIAAVPLHFERNDGQVDKRFDFTAAGAGYRVGLSSDSATVVLTDRGLASSAFRFTFVGARPGIAGQPLDTLPGTVSYYRGSQPSEWQTAVSTHARVRYPELFEGVDVVYYGNQGRLQYDFVVKPGANPSRIAFAVEGADSVSLGADGRLRMAHGGRVLEQERPFTYQVIEGQRREIPSRFVLEGSIVRFAVGAYDRSLPLVIDPVIAYASWLGGSGEEGILDMAVDGDGNLVVYGFAHDAQTVLAFPTTPGAIKSSRNDYDAFVTKFNATGSTLLFSTRIGGSGDEMVQAYNFIGGLALDGSNNVYITGTTRSANFPTTGGAFDTDYNDDDPGATGSDDGFHVKLSPTGGLLYGTYLGGRRSDEPHGIDVDAAGNVYVVGSTDSDEGVGTTGSFVLAGASYDTTYNGAGDLFLVRFSAAGALTYSTYLGGTSTDAVTASNVRASRTAANVVYVVSDTNSSTFPTTPATRLQGFSAGPDAVLVRLDLAQAAVNQLTYGTFFRGNGVDALTSLALDSTDKVSVAGATNSSPGSFPTAVTPAGTPSASGQDVLIARFDTAASGAASLVYGMSLNGFYSDTATDIALDSQNQAWVGVDSGSFQNTPTATDFPLRGDQLTTQRSGNGVRHAIVQVNAGTDLVLSSPARPLRA